MRNEAVFIAIGSNLGDRQDNISKALESLKSHPKIIVEKLSSIIETDPVAGPVQGKYLNAVVRIQTSLGPKEFLKILQSIENKLGRVRTVKNGPRTIDLDILLFGGLIVNEPGLAIPHPRMFERYFVLKPLFEIAPDLADIHVLVIPYKQTILDILNPR